MALAFLSTQRIALRPLEEADADGPYVDWFNDAEVCRGNSHHVFPYTRESALAYIGHARQTRDDLILAIVLRERGCHIGNVSLQGIHGINRSAEFAIVLGDRSVWGQGYAKEAALLILDHGFGALNLHRVGCGTFDDNLAMQRLALAMGMKEEGRRREAAFKGGRYVDIIEYGLVAQDYFARSVTPERSRE
jgi:RimJ/RimL family protein N-acetyltransferase